MKFAAGSLSSLLLILPFAVPSVPAPARAQPITPAPDGTGTTVTSHGNHFNIQGGSLSRDGANLFHSFQKFGLSEGQTANFLTTPDIRNILGRVVGGDASYINGLIGVAGGHPNLFLMNPAGILFGPNASLNVPASFTATAATGIGFGSGWFNAVGSNNYNILVGTPSAFNFRVSQPGAIVNEGNLSLTSGNTLALLGGIVINTGTLSSPGGNIIVVGVPGNSAVRLSQEGHLLSLDIEPVVLGEAEVTPVPHISLAQLLTGRPDFGHASRLTVNQKGEVSLTGSGVRVPQEAGTAIVSGSVDVSSPLTPQPPLPQGERGSGFGGGISVLGNRAGLVSANINASGTYGGGTVVIGGDYQGRSTGILPVHLPVHPPLRPLNASHTSVSSDSAINADALLNGNGGRVIIWSDKTTHFLGHISARGGSNSGNGGFVEVSGKSSLIFRGAVDLSAPKGTAGTLLLDPENITIADGNGGESDSQVTDRQVLFDEGTGTFTISEATLERLDGNADVRLEASNNITVADLSDSELTFQSGTGTITLTADADKNGTGTFSMNPADTIRAPGRNVTVEAAAIAAGKIDTSSELDGGAIALSATSDIVTGSLTSASTGTGTGGQIRLNSSAGGINTGAGTLNSTSVYGNGGNIALTAERNIVTGDIYSESVGELVYLGVDEEGVRQFVYQGGAGTRGTVTLESRSGVADPSAGNQSSSPLQGNAGTVTVTAVTADREEVNLPPSINPVPLPVRFPVPFLTQEPPVTSAGDIAELEQSRGREFANYFGDSITYQLTSTENIRDALATIASQTGNRSAIIYIVAFSEKVELVGLTPEGKSFSKTVPVKKEELLAAVRKFRVEITNPRQRKTTSYLKPAQQLYQWLVAPIEPELQAAKIDTLLFSMDAGLRSLPVAALHDGKQFLVEKYSLALIPSVSLMDTRYQPLQGKQLLAMGASEFPNQLALPAVPVELSEITQKVWQGKAFLNQDFTRNNLIGQRSKYPYPMIHLATHAEFQPGTVSNSYIQLWDDKLRLDELGKLRLNSPPVELLVLSACRTALGDEKAELGFAGFAVAAGVKTAVATLWYVSDAGTLGLMTEFYQHLRDVKIKADALRQAQLAMIRGEVRIEKGQLLGSKARTGIPLPPELLNQGNPNLSHPYYWSGFTMIGSPW